MHDIIKNEKIVMILQTNDKCADAALFELIGKRKAVRKC